MVPLKERLRVDSGFGSFVDDSIMDNVMEDDINSRGDDSNGRWDESSDRGDDSSQNVDDSEWSGLDFVDERTARFVRLALLLSHADSISVVMETGL